MSKTQQAPGCGIILASRQVTSQLGKEQPGPELSLMQQQQENGGATLSLTRVPPHHSLGFRAFPNPELQGLSTCRPGKVLRE